MTHIGDLAALEDQLCALTSDGYKGSDGSPDRANSLVWALTSLMVTAQRPTLVWGGLDRPSELDVARQYLVRG